LVFAERLSAAPSVHAPKRGKKSHHLLFSAPATPVARLIVLRLGEMGRRQHWFVTVTLAMPGVFGLYLLVIGSLFRFFPAQS
jgi:hypothetical protein